MTLPPPCRHWLPRLSQASDNDVTCIQAYWLDRARVEKLYQLLEPQVQPRMAPGRNTPTLQKVLMVLHYLATRSFQEDIAHWHATSQSAGASLPHGVDRGQGGWWDTGLGPPVPLQVTLCNGKIAGYMIGLLHLRRSETDQQGCGQLVRLQRATNMAFCLIRAMETYLQLALQGRRPLFRHLNVTLPPDITPVWGLSELGLLRVEFGLHSFQIRAASTAASIGFLKAVIRRIGRWRSRAFWYYVRK